MPQPKTGTKKKKVVSKGQGKAPAEVVVSPTTVPENKKKLGRPTSFTQELADAICADLAMGMSLRTACKGEDRPHVSTIFNWFRTQESFLEQYTRAKQEAADAMADEILDIADDGSNDWMEVHRGNYEGWEVNGEALQRSRLRVDTRKWLMSKMKPKVYGEKLDLTSGGEKLPTPILGTAVPKSEPIDGEIIEDNSQKVLEA